MHSRWVEYSKTQKAQSALARQSVEDIHYGEQVYCSPIVNSVSWLVLKYQDEYNVFTENTLRGRKGNRVWVECFKNEQHALEFALRMVLICGRKINRKDLHTL